MRASVIPRLYSGHRNRQTIVSFLIAVFLGACSPQPENAPAPQKTPTPAPEDLREVAIFQLRVLCAGLVIYRLHVGRFPDAEESVAALWNPPADSLAREKWRGPYTPTEDLLRDPWGHPFAYGPEDSSAMFDLRSLGPDGVLSKDDVVAAEVIPEFLAEIREELARTTPEPTLPER